MRIRLASLVLYALSLCLPGLAVAQEDVAAILTESRDLIEKPSRQTIAPVIDRLGASDDPAAADVLAAWADKRLGLRKADGVFFLIRRSDAGWDLSGLDGTSAGTAERSAITELKPNAGVRGMIATALVRFRLIDPDPARRAEALASMEADPAPAHLEPLRAAIADEVDPVLKARKTRLERLLTLRFGADTAERVAAIDSFESDLGLDLRAALNPLVATQRRAFQGPPPADLNIARRLTPGSDIPTAEAYALLVQAGLAPEPLSAETARAALAGLVADGAVAGAPVATLSDPAVRDQIWERLEAEGKVPHAATAAEIDAALAAHSFAEVRAEPDPTVSAAAEAALGRIQGRLGAMAALDLSLDALSLASIYFLAAIGLAITFGVMRVINMAHGEFIMMGSYTGYIVQTMVADRTLSILLALPLAFAVTFAAGVAMERLVIRHLAKRPLETLLATFGISIALQQLAKNIFGTQARPLTAPGWLDGAFVLNDVVAVSYIRIAIFVLALAFLGLFLWIMKRTSLGLQVRAVTQNPTMAASMGINPDRINMLTFGLGSGIAGIAGVAIGLFAKVTSELGSDYIVQSFMTVVVGGVGNIWGALAGATLIGFLQKGIEWFNPSNTLAAQTYMILFIILFIQFRPRGIIALRGRAAGD